MATLSYRIQPLTQELIPAARDFNARLAAAGVNVFSIDESHPTPHALDPSPPALHKDWFVVTRDGAVHGGFMLQRQLFWIRGKLRETRNIQLPISEGIIDRRHSAVAMLSMRHVMREHPLVFAVGMGDVGQPFPRLLDALRWRIAPAPFFFHVANARRVLRQLRPLRRTFLRGAIADLLALSGAGPLAFRAAGAAGRSRPIGDEGPRAQELAEWPAWVDRVWVESRDHYSMIGLRDHSTLPLLYPLDGSCVAHAVVCGREPVGWVVTLDTQMADNKYFGDLRVGTILDGLTTPGYEEVAVRCATRRLEQAGVDLVVTNQTHEAWKRGLLASGYATYTSNYLVATSPGISSLLDPPGEHSQGIHITRGDGDGRIHL